MEDGKGSNAASPAVQDAIPSVEEATMPLNSSVATPVDVSISTAHDIQDTTTTTETTPAFGGAQAFHGQEGQPPASLGGFFWEILSYVGSGMEEGKEHDPLLPAVGVATEADAKQSVDEQSPDSGKPHDARPKTPSVQRRMSFNLPNLSSVAAQTSSLVAAQTSSLVECLETLWGYPPQPRNRPLTNVILAHRYFGRPTMMEQMAMLSPATGRQLLLMWERKSRTPPLFLSIPCWQSW
ncbi:hypothetical protein BC829DRAFT_209194 [Chytridium lagenaria]|nr:hypothetical protein BC829DRAFT_209194 [Chytridium lagenaria]